MNTFLPTLLIAFAIKLNVTFATIDHCPGGSVNGLGNTIQCNGTNTQNLTCSSNTAAQQGSKCTSAAKDQSNDAAAANWVSNCIQLCLSQSNAHPDPKKICVTDNATLPTVSGSCNGAGVYRGSISKICQCKERRKPKKKASPVTL